MKKKLILMATMLTLATQAKAEGVYLGVEAQHNRLKVKGQDSFYEGNTTMPSFVVGYSFPVVDIEASYFRSLGTKSTNGNGMEGLSNTYSKIDYQTLSVDAVKSFSVIEELPALKVFGLAGLQIARAEIEENFNYFGQSFSDSNKKTGYGYSVGAGISYDIDKNIALRLKAKYSDVNLKMNGLSGTGGIDNAMAYSAGVIFKF